MSYNEADTRVKLEKILAKIEEVKKLQTEVQKELGNLTNSVLDKAFKGEL